MDIYDKMTSARRVVSRNMEDTSGS